MCAWRAARGTAAPRRPRARPPAPPPGLAATVRAGLAVDALLALAAVGAAAVEVTLVAAHGGPLRDRAGHLLVVVTTCLLPVAVRAGMRDRSGPGPVAPSRHLLALAPVAFLPPLLWLVTRQAGLPAPPDAVCAAVTIASGLLLLARAAVALHGAQWLIEHDVPTGVLNVRGLTRVAGERAARRAGGPLVLCVVGLDDFKGLNDSLGGERGDALLALVAARLTAHVGPSATVARLGGDRFLALVPDHDGAGEDLLAAFAEPFPGREHPVRLTASIGVAPVPAGSPELTGEVLGSADLAMQAAKADGKATAVRYHPELHERIHAPHRLARDLRDLLDGAPVDRVGRLAVHYQPVVDLRGGGIVGCEALVRWWRPGQPVIMPDAFLRVAERDGLIQRLDRVVLDLALADLVRWDAAGLGPLVLSVNLGRESMIDPDLPALVRAVLEEHAVAPRRLRLEITEHAELPDDDVTAKALRSLTELGVRFSLDDFGTGYSSLHYLCRYPVDLVKLDRSLVAAEGERDSSPLLEGIVGLASALHLDVLAEGVETRAQADRLAALGIAYGQGNLYAEPLEAEAFAAAAGGTRPTAP